MSNFEEPNPINVPAFMRKKGLEKRAKDKLLNAAYDYKQKGLLEQMVKEVAPKPKRVIRSRRKKLAEPIIADFNSDLDYDRYRAQKTAAAFDSPILTFETPVIDSESITSSEPAFRKIVRVGNLSEFLSKIEVGIIELEGTLREGDLIQIDCEYGLFQQKVESMQINRKDVKTAKKGACIGLKLKDKPRINGAVYKMI